MDEKSCRFCEMADTKREKCGDIRCLRFSKWVNPFGCCGWYNCKDLFDKLQRAKEMEKCYNDKLRRN